MKRTFSYLASLSLAVISCLCLLVATERQAHAYIDPGSGLLALQSAASVAAAVGYFLRRRIRALFGRKSAIDETSTAPIAPATATVAINSKDASRAA